MNLTESKKTVCIQGCISGDNFHYLLISVLEREQKRKQLENRIERKQNEMRKLRVSKKRHE